MLSRIAVEDSDTSHEAAPSRFKRIKNRTKNLVKNKVKNVTKRHIQPHKDRIKKVRDFFSEDSSQENLDATPLQRLQVD